MVHGAPHLGGDLRVGVCRGSKTREGAETPPQAGDADRLAPVEPALGFGPRRVRSGPARGQLRAGCTLLHGVSKYRTAHSVFSGTCADLRATLQNAAVPCVTCSGTTGWGKPWLSAGGPCSPPALTLPFSHPASPRLLSESVVSLGLPDPRRGSCPHRCFFPILGSSPLPAIGSHPWGSPFFQIRHGGLSAEGAG